MRSFEYAVTVKPERSGAFTVTFSDIPEAITSGRNRHGALVQAADCLEEAIAGRIADDPDVPAPGSPRRNQPVVAVPAPMAAKAALYLAMREAGIAKTELARRLRCDEREVRRMLDPRHATKLATVARALQAVGKRLVIGMDEAAA